ncbi:MAG: hypothetical protein AAGG02_01215 [Cyanobacteria bacterium P01_H01_bin.15]
MDDSDLHSIAARAQQYSLDLQYLQMKVRQLEVENRQLRQLLKQSQTQLPQRTQGTTSRSARKKASLKLPKLPSDRRHHY